MESSLHRALKQQYAADGEGRSEVSIGGFRIDAIGLDGILVEVQSGPLGPLRGKLGRLLPDYRIRIIKPVILRRRVVRRLEPDGPDLSARQSPKRGALHDVFDDLIGVVRVFPHANLAIEVLGVTVDEIRLASRRRPGYIVADRRLGTICSTWTLAGADDLWALLPTDCDGITPFTTADLSRRLERPRWFAQRVAYCLRLVGAARVLRKDGNERVYVRA